NRAGLPLQRRDHRCCLSENHIGLQVDHLFRLRLQSAGGCKAIVDADIAALRPSESLDLLLESRKSRFRVRMVLGGSHQHADPPYSIGLLRACRQRPSRRAAEERDELAPSRHSITLSARVKNSGGTTSPIDSAAFMLTTRSSCVGCSTGKSAGL